MKDVLNELLMEDKTFLRIPFGDGTIDIFKSVVITWGVTVFLLILMLFLTRDFRVHNISKRQAAVESFVIWIRNMTGDMLGEEAIKYADYMATVLIFITFSNMVGLFGFTPATMDLNNGHWKAGAYKFVEYMLFFVRVFANFFFYRFNLENMIAAYDHDKAF